MKNICFVDYDVTVMGGIEKVVISLANALSEKYNVHIISIHASEKSSFYKINDDIKVKILFDKELRIRDFIIKSFFPLKKYIKDNKIDIVFIEGNYPAPICSWLKFFTNAKFVFCDHGALCNQMDNRKIVTFRKIASSICHKTVALTEKSKNDYIKTFKMKPEKVTYIYNWIDDNLLKNNRQYNEKSTKIMTAGRFGKEKGYDILVDVSKLVFAKHCDWQWDLYGEGEEFENIKNKIHANGLENNVILKGQTSELCELYNEYSMLVLTSYREGLPLVLLEAKVNKLPIISFDIDTGPAEIITNGIDGFLIAPYNVKSMAEKICFLIENAHERKRMASNFQNRLDLFKQETILKQWIKLIEEI